MSGPSLDDLLNDLYSKERLRILRALYTIAGNMEPTGSELIRAALEPLLKEKWLCHPMVGAERVYCEVGWLAGQALAYERALIGEEEPVVVENTPFPFSESQLRAYSDGTLTRHPHMVFHPVIMRARLEKKWGQ